MEGADLQFRSGMAEKYIPYSLRRQIGDWKAEWFYIHNHAPALPERALGPPKPYHETSIHLVSLSTATRMCEKPPGAIGSGPIMSRLQQAKGQGGGMVIRL